MKNLTNFYKKVEAGLDPRLYMRLYQMNQDQLRIKLNRNVHCTLQTLFFLQQTFNMEISDYVLNNMASLSPG